MRRLSNFGFGLGGLVGIVLLLFACGGEGDRQTPDSSSTAASGSNPSGGTGPTTQNNGPAAPTASPGTFRFDTAVLVDPHVFLTNNDGTKADLTTVCNQVFSELNTKDQFTTQAQQGADGILDMSIIGVFRPLDTQAESVQAELTVAHCQAPYPSTGCIPVNQAVALSAKVHNKNADCFKPYAGTTGGYSPAPNNPTGRCFVSDAADLTLPLLAGISIPFKQGKVAASYEGAKPTQLTSGIISAFLSEEQAQNTRFPTDIPLLGGQPISVLFKVEDMDQLVGGQKGWWLYFNFSASSVPYTE